MFCTSCGNELPSVARFCPGCGLPIGVAETEAEAAEIIAESIPVDVDVATVLDDSEVAIKLAEIHENAETDRVAIVQSAAVEIAQTEATAEVAEAEAGADAAQAVAETVLATEVDESPNEELIEELADEAEALEEEAEEHLESAEELDEEIEDEEDSAPVPGHWWFKERGRKR